MDALHQAHKERLLAMTPEQQREVYEKYASDRRVYNFSCESFEDYLVRWGIPWSDSYRDLVSARDKK